MRHLVFGLAALVLFMAACSPRATVSRCELMCLSVRDDLIQNFGIAPSRVDCSDTKWEGDCAYCVTLLRRDFDVQPEGGCT